MIISIENYGTAHTVTFPGDEPGLQPAIRAVVNLLVAAGYSREGIAKLFVDGDPNTWERAWPVPEDAA